MIILSNEKKKRVSKKKKSSWRKHVNIQDVDNYLEEQRLEERLGGPLSVLKDDQLFTIETDKKEKQLTAKEKKRLRLIAPPKCFGALQPHTKVPDPITKRNRVRTKEERMCPILRKKEHERKLKGILKPKELQSVNDRKKYEEKLKEKETDTFSQDIWNTNEKLDANEWIDQSTERHMLRGLGRLNKVVPRLKSDKNTFIPSVEIPHPGTSYNPSFKDHNDLLQEIAEKETKIIKQEKHINRVTKDMFRKIPKSETETAWLVEMSQELPTKEQADDTNVEDESEYDNDDKPYKSVNPPVVNKKKTLKQRRKQKEQLLLKEARILSKLEKKKTVDIHKLHSIKNQIENLEKNLEKQKARREKLSTLKKKEPKQLSKLKYEEPDVEFNMRQDLKGNLRNVKKEGYLLIDRFRSFQKRNILEVSARYNRKKAKVKKFIKTGFEDDWKKTVANVNLLQN